MKLNISNKFSQRIKNCFSMKLKWLEIFKNKHARNECYLWLLINGLLCQMPLVFMYINDIPNPTIFSSGLSYLFTLYIASMYMLFSIREKNHLTIFDLKNIRFIFSIIAIIITFGLLCIYPNIKKDWVRKFLVGCPGLSYTIIMVCSLIAAFAISWPSLVNKIKENIEKENSTQEYKKSKSTEEKYDSDLTKMQEEIFE